MMGTNKFIVFEGIDGSGKSTQSKLLQDYLAAAHIPFHGTLEPTNNFIGTQIRAILTGKQKGHPLTVANLFAADRYDHLTNEDYGLLAQKQHQHIICDRYLLSSYAYQSLDAPLEWIKEINKYNEALLWPDLVIYIQISPELAMKRILEHRNQVDLFETQEKLTAIYDNYQSAISLLSPKQKETIWIIDGSLPIPEIQQQIIDKFHALTNQ